MKPQTLLLAIDNVSLPLRRNLTLHITKPYVHPEPVLTPRLNEHTMPDHLAAHFYGTVLHEEGKFRMWYSPCGKGPDPALPKEALEDIPYIDAAWTRGPICYAESTDGINWERPNLGQFAYRGNKEHNGLDMGFDSIAGAAIIRDDRDPDPARRYKAVFTYYIYTGDTCATLGGATSPDGIHWTPGPLNPLNRHFFEATGFHRHGDMYVAIGQKGGDYYSENGTHSSRQGRAHVSYDFESWTSAHADSLLLPEPRDASLRSTYGKYDQVHVGIGTANYNNVTVGLYGFWHNDPDFRNISCDLGLAISNDGLSFRQVVQGMPYLKQEDSPIVGFDNATPHVMLTQGNGIVNVGDRTLIYHGRWTNGNVISGPSEHFVGSYDLHLEYIDEYYADIALAEIERDRWGGLGLFPDTTDGHVWTLPVRLPDDMSKFQLSLNATDVSGLNVSIAKEDLQLIDGFGDGTGAGDGFDSAVRWSGDLGNLAGQSVRFRIDFNRGDNLEPRLYALNIDGIG